MVFKKVDDVDEDGKPIKRYASGRISTTGLVSPLYGFFEARFETLPVEGMQSAWWLWAENGLWNYENGTPDVGCPGSGSLFESPGVCPCIRRVLSGELWSRQLLREKK